MALAHAELGENEQAFERLDRAFNERAPGARISLKVGYVWDNLRPDPRFAALMRRANF
jgi:hypothetical protein